MGRIHLPLNGNLTDDTFVKRSIIKTFFVFHPILMKLGEVVVHVHVYYNFTKFHKNRMKNKKVFIIECLTEVSSDKVALRSC